MSVTGETENGPVPGSVFSPRQVRILKVAVIVMGVLLVGGFAFVLAAIVYQASHSAQDKGTAAAVGAQGENTFEVPIPRDAAVTSLALDGNRLAVHLNGAEGPEILVIDLGSGKVAARIKLKPQ
jgi:hypothetical protein